MIDRPGDNTEKKKKKEKQGGNANNKSVDIDLNENEEEEEEIPEPEDNTGAFDLPANFLPSKFGKKGAPSPGPGKGSKPTKSPKPGSAGKAGKKPREWDFGGTARDAVTLDRTKDGNGAQDFVPDRSMVGKMLGGIKSLEIKKDSGNKENSGGVINLFKGLVGGKTLTTEDTDPILEKLRDHLIAKNVASDVSTKLCESVATKLHGKVLGTFKTVSATVKSALEESLLALLQPEKPVDVLRDALEAKRQGRPFIITFCGVNGVGKSTNLAKICFWLIENDLKVLVAACDTFRAGAVEQLRTHARHLNALHPPRNGQACVELYEKGYGKDAAGVAAEAISFAKEARKDVVLVDTAGRMQDNEPLMRAMAKLIRVNHPDLVLFVGEALVGNEAVDQLVKFNRALADFSDQSNPRLIDGIVLTKFDTIDDKVGAAVSMAYITGKPIVFVGTGQTYTDLRSLDSQAVVSALMS
jgi:signal recognition particle receptor subunit alpha